MHTIKIETDNFNKGIESLLGDDSYSMYYKPLTIVENYIITILQTEFNESKDGAEWFVDEGLAQIERGGTEIGIDNKTYHIKSLKDYYNYLISLNEK